MKKIIFLFLTALLTACSSGKPNLVHTHDPILNIESTLYPNIQVSPYAESATIKNISDHILSMQYLVTWYDKNGVTQLPEGISEEQFQGLVLQSRQKTDLQFNKPTDESVNYRLYMALK